MRSSPLYFVTFLNQRMCWKQLFNAHDWVIQLKHFTKIVAVNYFLRIPVDTGRKLNVNKTFRKRPGRLLNVLCTFSLRPVSTGMLHLICLIGFWISLWQQLLTQIQQKCMHLHIWFYQTLVALVFMTRGLK